MAVWTDESTMLLDINDPARSKDQKAKGENLQAAFAGETGAPDLLEAALSVALAAKVNAGANGALFNPSTTGTTFTSKFMGGNSLEYTITTEEPLLSSTAGSGIDGSSPAGGDITIETTSTTSTLTGTVLRIKIYKNRANVVNFTVPAGVSGQVDTNNVSTARGDTISITCSIDGGGSSGFGTVDSSFVKTGNDTLGVI